MPRKRTTIGQMLKRLREERNISQLQLAQQAGVAQGYISDLEAGTKANPSVDVLKKLAKALNCSIAELLG